MDILIYNIIFSAVFSLKLNLMHLKNNIQTIVQKAMKCTYSPNNYNKCAMHTHNNFNILSSLTFDLA
jgi:hypothetical protein